MEFRSFLIKYAEIGVKGRNRGIFEDALVRQIRHALKGCEGEFAVRRTRGRVYVEVLSESYDYEETIEGLKTVFGIAQICPMIELKDEGFESLCRAVASYMGEAYPDRNLTFKVNTRRARKDYPMESMEVNSEIGGVLLDAYPEMKVDVCVLH